MKYTIMIISEDNSSDSYNNLNKALTALGHTVIYVATSSSSVISGVDLIMIPRYSTNVIEKYIVQAVNSGIPLITCGDRENTNSTCGVGNGILNALNLASNIVEYPSHTPNTTFNQNALNYSQLTNYANSSVQIYNSNPSFEFGMTSNNISQNAITLSTPNGSNNTGYVDLALFPIGTKDISGNLLNATVIFCGWLYSNGTTYTQTAVTLISNLIDMALKHYYISGKITDSNNNALVRKVRVYDKTTGYMLTETLSNSDGTYSLTVHQNTPMYVVCIHDSSDSNNSQILDDIIPYSN